MIKNLGVFINNRIQVQNIPFFNIKVTVGNHTLFAKRIMEKYSPWELYGFDNADLFFLENNEEAIENNRVYDQVKITLKLMLMYYNLIKSYNNLNWNRNVFLKNVLNNIDYYMEQIRFRDNYLYKEINKSFIKNISGESDLREVAVNNVIKQINSINKVKYEKIYVSKSHMELYAVSKPFYMLLYNSLKEKEILTNNVLFQNIKRAGQLYYIQLYRQQELIKIQDNMVLSNSILEMIKTGTHEEQLQVWNLLKETNSENNLLFKNVSEKKKGEKEKIFEEYNQSRVLDFVENNSSYINWNKLNEKIIEKLEGNNNTEKVEDSKYSMVKSEYIQESIEEKIIKKLAEKNKTSEQKQELQENQININLIEQNRELQEKQNYINLINQNQRTQIDNGLLVEEIQNQAEDQTVVDNVLSNVIEQMIKIGTYEEQIQVWNLLKETNLENNLLFKNSSEEKNEEIFEEYNQSRVLDFVENNSLYINWNKLNEKIIEKLKVNSNIDKDIKYSMEKSEYIQESIEKKIIKKLAEKNKTSEQKQELQENQISINLVEQNRELQVNQNYINLINQNQRIQINNGLLVEEIQNQAEDQTIVNNVLSNVIEQMIKIGTYEEQIQVWNLLKETNLENNLLFKNSSEEKNEEIFEEYNQSRVLDFVENNSLYINWNKLNEKIIEKLEGNNNIEKVEDTKYFMEKSEYIQESIEEKIIKKLAEKNKTSEQKQELQENQISINLVEQNRELQVNQNYINLINQNQRTQINNGLLVEEIQNQAEGQTIVNNVLSNVIEQMIKIGTYEEQIQVWNLLKETNFENNLLFKNSSEEKNEEIFEEYNQSRVLDFVKNNSSYINWNKLNEKVIEKLEGNNNIEKVEDTKYSMVKSEYMQESIEEKIIKKLAEKNKASEQKQELQENQISINLVEQNRELQENQNYINLINQNQRTQIDNKLLVEEIKNKTERQKSVDNVLSNIISQMIKTGTYEEQIQVWNLLKETNFKNNLLFKNSSEEKNEEIFEEYNQSRVLDFVKNNSSYINWNKLNEKVIEKLEGNNIEKVEDTKYSMVKSEYIQESIEEKIIKKLAEKNKTSEQKQELQENQISINLVEQARELQENQININLIEQNRELQENQNYINLINQNPRTQIDNKLLVEEIKNKVEQQNTVDTVLSNTISQMIKTGTYEEQIQVWNLLKEINFKNNLLFKNSSEEKNEEIFEEYNQSRILDFVKNNSSYINWNKLNEKIIEKLKVNSNIDKDIKYSMEKSEYIQESIEEKIIKKLAEKNKTSEQKQELQENQISINLLEQARELQEKQININLIEQNRELQEKQININLMEQNRELQENQNYINLINQNQRTQIDNGLLVEEIQNQEEDQTIVDNVLSNVIEQMIKIGTYEEQIQVWNLLKETNFEKNLLFKNSSEEKNEEIFEEYNQSRVLDFVKNNSSYINWNKLNEKVIEKLEGNNNIEKVEDTKYSMVKSEYMQESIEEKIIKKLAEKNKTSEQKQELQKKQININLVEQYKELLDNQNNINLIHKSKKPQSNDELSVKEIKNQSEQQNIFGINLRSTISQILKTGTYEEKLKIWKLLKEKSTKTNKLYKTISEEINEEVFKNNNKSKMLNFTENNLSYVNIKKLSAKIAKTPDKKQNITTSINLPLKRTLIQTIKIEPLHRKFKNRIHINNQETSLKKHKEIRKEKDTLEKGSYQNNIHKYNESKHQYSETLKSNKELIISLQKRVETIAIEQNLKFNKELILNKASSENLINSYEENQSIKSREIQYKRKQEESINNEIQKQQNEIKLLIGKVDTQEKLITELKKNQAELTQIKTLNIDTIKVTKEVMKQIEDRLWIEKMRRGLD